MVACLYVNDSTINALKFHVRLSSIFSLLLQQRLSNSSLTVSTPCKGTLNDAVEVWTNFSICERSTLLLHWHFHHTGGYSFNCVGEQSVKQNTHW